MADLNVEEKRKDNNDNNNNKEDRLNPYRCPKYYLIPSITMYEEDNNLYV